MAKSLIKYKSPKLSAANSAQMKNLASVSTDKSKIILLLPENNDGNSNGKPIFQAIAM